MVIFSSKLQPFKDSPHYYCHAKDSLITDFKAKCSHLLYTITLDSSPIGVVINKYQCISFDTSSPAKTILTNACCNVLCNS
jgi:hypothetical protein